MTVCIQYAQPSSGQDEGEVYGLDVAVDNFLRAWFRHGTQGKFICRPVDMPSFDHFRELAREAGIDPEKRCIGLDPRTPQHNLETISCLFRADPLITGPIWQRRQLRGRGYAACGLVHTMSGERIARAVGELCLAPSGEADALICPSAAVRDAVQSLWEIHADYLNHRFGGKFSCPMQTPVIPLGIDTEKFSRITTPEKRAAQRAVLGAETDEIVVLFVGRLSFATKAHPLALWRAAERAAKASRRKLRVVMYGYFKPKDMEAHFRNLAGDVLKTAKIDFVMNGDPRFPDGLWAGADIFASLSDNIQESFGLTPVEAMAASLPTVISDWNGYRGAARDGADGFLIPTAAPPFEAGMAIANQYYNEQNYGVALVGASQSTAVDIARCAEALRLLAEDDGKRLSMGKSARARAQEIFDWRHTIRAYEELWKELAQKRRAGPPQPEVPEGWQAANPAFPNPLRMFRSFPSATLAPADVVRVVLEDGEIEMLLRHEMNLFAPEFLMPKKSLLELIGAIRRAVTPRIEDILAPFKAEDHTAVWRCLGWMLKLGICELKRD